MKQRAECVVYRSFWLPNPPFCGYQKRLWAKEQGVVKIVNDTDVKIPVLAQEQQLAQVPRSAARQQQQQKQTRSCIQPQVVAGGDNFINQLLRKYCRSQTQGGDGHTKSQGYPQYVYILSQQVFNPVPPLMLFFGRLAPNAR